MSDALDALPTPWRHVRLPVPPGHPGDVPPPLGKVWLPPVPAGSERASVPEWRARGW